MQLSDAIRSAASVVIDEGDFGYFFVLFGTVGTIAMPTEDPTKRRLQVGGEGTLQLSDIPINRAGLAVTKDLHAKGYDEPSRMAVMLRLMHFGELLESSDPRLARWIERDGHAGHVRIAEALVCAAARARIVVPADLSKPALLYDVDDVVEQAEAIERRLERDDSPVA